MRPQPEPCCQEKILDAAECAFAEGGFDGASMRQIVQQAGVNLALAYYYFGSKEGLLAAVLDRRFAPLREAHRRGMEELTTAYGEQPVPVEKILESMLLPPLRLTATRSAESEAVRRLIGRIVTDPNLQTRKLVHRQHEHIRESYLAALRRTLPGIPEADLQWRFEFVWGALALVLCNPGKLEVLTGGVCNPADTDTVLKQMIQFFSTGFRAPAAEPAAKPGRKPRRRPAV